MESIQFYQMVVPGTSKDVSSEPMQVEGTSLIRIHIHGDRWLYANASAYPVVHCGIAFEATHFFYDGYDKCKSMKKLVNALRVAAIMYM